MTTNPDRAAMAIVGLVGVFMIALGISVIAFGYSTAAGTLEAAKILARMDQPRNAGNLAQAWAPTMVGGSVMTLLGMAFVFLRRWIVATCVSSRADDTATSEGESIFVPLIVAVGLVLVALATAVMVAILVSNAIELASDNTEGLVFSIVLLAFGGALVLRPNWVMRLTGRGHA